ncbi:ribonuclease III [Candidatus Kaiserbacteria bacterium]|nr:ribonuclease III [Candidatus Kaiserbacteria bacterium]
MERTISDFEATLGVSFNDKNLLRQAFTHRSYINEHKETGLEHNERLEFLGDAVLELAVTDFLFKKYPEKTEGDLTAYRAALVNTNTLGDASLKLGINDYLLLSKGEAQDTGRARQYILANTFESIVGALYLDQGYDAAQKFIADSLFDLTEDIVSQRLWQDAKSNFQERAQENTGITPRYELIEEKGPDHNKEFVVGVYLNAELVASGKGSSKQEAEQEAAQNALKVKGW